MIEARGVSHAYRARPALRDVSLALSESSVVGLVGPNGSGKTTLLKRLAGLLHGPGEVRYQADLIDDLGARELARRRAFVPQGEGEPFPYTVGEVVAMGRAHRHRFFAAPVVAGEVAALLAELAFPADAERRFDALSGGERQLVMVARALYQGSSLLLLDEPASHLDLKHQAALARALVRRARAGATVVWSMHDVNLAAAVCDTLVLMQKGAVVACGSPAAVLEPARLSAIYEVALRVDAAGASPRVELAREAFTERSGTPQ